MLIVGYCFGIRSEGKLCEEVRLHLAYRWFCRVDLNDAVPHHSTFSENRLNRFRESDILRHIFACVVIAAMGMGLVKGEGFAVDASVMEADPAAFIRSAASHVRTDGLIAFHEIAVYGECHAVPPVPLWEQCWKWVTAAFRSVMVHPDAAGRMTAHFHDAGLKQPTIFCEIPVGGGPDSPVYAWWARTLRSVLPQLEKIGAATAAEVDIDTLEDRLRNAVSAVHSQVLCPM
jgi:Transposase domain (DUF772)